MKPKTYMGDRIKTLEEISGLVVTVYKNDKGNVFAFYVNGKPFASCFTYDKAKLFAEGVKLGKTIGSHIKAFAEVV